MGQVKTIEPLTERFLLELQRVESQGVKRKDIAKAMGLSPSSLSNISNREHNVQKDQWDKFRKEYGISEFSERNFLEEFLSEKEKVLQEKEARRIETEKRASQDGNRVDRLLNIVETNLIDISRTQQLLYAFARAALEFEISKASGEDENKVNELKDILSKSLGDYMKIDLKEDKALSLHK